MENNKFGNKNGILWTTIWIIGFMVIIGILLVDPNFGQLTGGDKSKIMLFALVGWPVILGMFIGTILYKLVGII